MEIWLRHHAYGRKHCHWNVPIHVSPDPDGAVEIAYSITSVYQGKDYATEAAAALIDYACKNGGVCVIRANTLPETKASTRVLQKCGFKKVGEIVDPEGMIRRGNYILKRSPR